MTKEELITLLKENQELSIYVEIILKNEDLIPVLLEIMETDKTAIKYQAEKIIRGISEENPDLIYPYVERIVALLDSHNNFIKWGVILTIGNLLSFDKDNKWPSFKNKYLVSLKTPQIAEFGNIVSCIPKIVKIHKEEEAEIINHLLNIDSQVFLNHDQVSTDCLNVAKGLIIDCFDEIFETSNSQEEIIRFVKDNLNNERSQTKKKAAKFLRKYTRYV